MTPKFKRGDVRSDGYFFHAYFKHKNGRIYERWQSSVGHHGERINNTLQTAKARSRKSGLPFDLTKSFLLSIFPSDGMCPALGIPMVWGGNGIDNSPSLDRRIPELGYVIGNVEFLSNRANRIKTNATPDEVLRVANYLKGKN